MNIVFHRYNSICEPAYIDAYKSLGIEVIEDDLEMTDKSIPADVRISTIAGLILKNRPLFVFSINFFPYISDICDKLGCLYVCVTVDCPVAELYSVSIRNKCNRIFLFDSAQYEEIAGQTLGEVIYLPLGVNPAIADAAHHTQYRYDVSFIGSLYNEKNPYAVLRSKLSARVRGKCDGLLDAQELIGGLEILDSVIKKDSGMSDITAEMSGFLPDALKDSGDMLCDIPAFWTVDSCLGFELTVRDRLLALASMAESLGDAGSVHLFTRSDVSELKSLSPHIMIHDGVDTLKGMPEVFAASKINLNITMRPIRRGLPQRIWDILGCGGFLLTDVRADMPAELIPGVHFETYESVDEACEKIGYYLAHDEEREQIARNGRTEALANHTVLARVVTMISYIADREEIS